MRLVKYLNFTKEKRKSLVTPFLNQSLLNQNPDHNSFYIKRTQIMKNEFDFTGIILKISKKCNNKYFVCRFKSKHLVLPLLLLFISKSAAALYRVLYIMLPFL